MIFLPKITVKSLEKLRVEYLRPYDVYCFVLSVSKYWNNCCSCKISLRKLNWKSCKIVFELKLLGTRLIYSEIYEVKQFKALCDTYLLIFLIMKINRSDMFNRPMSLFCFVFILCAFLGYMGVLPEINKK